MELFKRSDGFARYSLFALFYNIVVILWGVFLRASKSGDGCGQHWLTCHGEIIPSAPELKTIIEFSHRLSSGLAFVFVLVLVIWAFRRFQSGSPVRKTSLVAFVFIVTEALVGAGLVLTGNTAEAFTTARPFWMAGHLANTFVLLAFLTLTCWFSLGGEEPAIKGKRREIWVLAAAVAGVFFVGITGSVAALSNMLFPSETIASGIAADISPVSPLIVRLRVLHPISSVVIGVLLFVASGWLNRAAGGGRVASKASGALSLLIVAQLILGGLTLVTGAPILMQLGHLLVADLIWISLVVLGVSVLSAQNGTADKLTA